MSSSWPEAVPRASFESSSANAMAPFLAHPEDYWQDSSGRHTDYESASLKINPPRVVFDNTSDPVSTLVKVDSANKHGCLLQVVQLLTDLDLVISKAHISSDGGWFVDVFHVTDQHGFKVTDPKMISYIQQVLGAVKEGASGIEVKTCLGRSASDLSHNKLTAVELSGVDRIGLLHEVAAALTSMQCNVFAAEVWTNNRRAALVVYVDAAPGGAGNVGGGGPVTDPGTLLQMHEKLQGIMRSRDGSGCMPRASLHTGAGHTGRRMHQLMFADRDFEPRQHPAQAPKQLQQYHQHSAVLDDLKVGKTRPSITIKNSLEKSYSIINIRCQDRPKLLFDTVCTLTDMQYIIHHATIDSEDGVALQEYYVRTMEGNILESEAERERVVKCLEAAIQRHTPEGVRLELCASDRVGLLADVTRVLSDKQLSITAANVCTRNGKAVNEFYVVDESGKPVERRILEAVRREIGPSVLAIRESSQPCSLAPGSPQRAEPAKFSFAGMIRAQSERLLMSLGLTGISEEGGSP